MRIKTRCVRHEASRKARPWRAKLKIAGKTVDLGWWATREEGLAACKGARKAAPARQAGRPPMSGERQRAILETYRQVKSQAKTAQAHGVSEKTVQRLWHAARPTLENYPDTHTALI